MLPMRKALMLIREHIAQLVGQALGVALFSSTRKLQFYVELAKPVLNEHSQFIFNSVICG